MWKIYLSQDCRCQVLGNEWKNGIECVILYLSLKGSTSCKNPKFSRESFYLNISCHIRCFFYAHVQKKLVFNSSLLDLSCKDLSCKALSQPEISWTYLTHINATIMKSSSIVYFILKIIIKMKKKISYNVIKTLFQLYDSTAAKERPSFCV